MEPGLVRELQEGLCGGKGTTELKNHGDYRRRAGTNRAGHPHAEN
jgi:hypothetical protein